MSGVKLGWSVHRDRRRQARRHADKRPRRARTDEPACAPRHSAVIRKSSTGRRSVGGRIHRTDTHGQLACKLSLRALLRHFTAVLFEPSWFYVRSRAALCVCVRAMTKTGMHNTHTHQTPEAILAPLDTNRAPFMWAPCEVTPHHPCDPTGLRVTSVSRCACSCMAMWV